MVVEPFINFSYISTTSPDFMGYIGQYIFYCSTVMFCLFYDQKHISRGIKNIAPIQLVRERRLLASIISLLISYFFITFYAILMVQYLVHPFLTSLEFTSPDKVPILLMIFILSSGVIVRCVYVLSSTAFGSVLWDFYAVPGIFLALFLFSSYQIDRHFIYVFFMIEICSCIIGVIAEVGLVRFRGKVRNTLERDYLHEVIDLVPLSSKVISGRNELYSNLATIIEKGIVEKQSGRTACGTSIFFECDNEGRYDKAVESFIGNNCGDIRYIGPLTKQYWEDNKDWEIRRTNIENRRKLGIKVRNHPSTFDSFRFLIINQKYVSIEFPMSPQPIRLQDYPRSVIAISFDNSVIASMLQALFDVMWDNAEEI